MNTEYLRPGMIVDYHHDPVEILEIDYEQNIAQVRRQSDQRHFTANCRELFEDPQMHTDSNAYY